MAHPARLSLRAPPHLPFIQGYPGILASSSSRKQPTVDGQLELRVAQNTIKAKWVRVELRKYESLPPGFPTSSQGETWDHVGEICNLWTAKDKEWDVLEQGDFKFSLPLPDDLPSSVEMPQGKGIRYELVAALCYRQKGGVFKKEGAPIIKVTEHLRIIRHDLHSAWPVYNIPDTTVGSNNDLTLTVQRPWIGIGPNDRMLLTATLKSNRPSPFQLKGFECQLVELVTALPQQDQAGTKKKSRQSVQPVTRSRVVTSARIAVSESLGRGGEKSARVDMNAPSGDKMFLTVSRARLLRIEYKLEVKAVLHGAPELKMGGMIYTVGPFSRANAQQAVNDIGYVETLCPGVVRPDPSPKPSMNSSAMPRPTSAGQLSNTNFGPNAQGRQTDANNRPATFAGRPQSIQGFTPNEAFRRQLSSGSTATTNTTMTTMTNMTGRPYSVAMPAPSAYTPLKTDTGSAAPPLQPSASPMLSSDSHERMSSEISHDSRMKRYSTATSATFGRWDRDLQNAISGAPVRTGSSPTGSPAIPGTSSPPGPQRKSTSATAWPNAEQEKLKLYDDARSRAVVSQSATGASLDTIGMEGPPPEYEPPPPGDPLFPLATKIPAVTITQPSLTTDSSAAGPSRLPSSSYASAAEEKETQRRRFQEAQNRVVSGSSSGTPRASGSSTDPSIPIDAGSASLTSRSSPGPSIAVDAGPAPRQPRSSAGPSYAIDAGPVPGPATPRTVAIPTGLVGSTEKEQMKRFYEAQDRVARSGAPESSSAARQSRPSDPSPSGSGSAAGITDKEQMKRFYEAQDRVARASISPDRSKATEQSPTPGASSSTATPALSEKEQMKRFYEAQDRVSRRSLNPGESSSSSSSAKPLGSGTPNHKSSPQTALSEKEQMRRYYEAQDRVARAATGSPPSTDTQTPNAGPSTAAIFPDTPDTPTPAVAGPSRRIMSGSGSGSGSGSTSSPLTNRSEYMSASEEKEMMKQRFERAQEAVQKKMNGSSSSSSPPPPSSFTASSSRPEPVREPSYSSTSPLAKEVLARASSRTSDPKDLGPADGPPPPLPAKPPMEYINLYSPVDSNPTSPWRPFGEKGQKPDGHARNISVDN